MASDLGIKQINSKKKIEFVFDSLSEKVISNILKTADAYENLEVTSDFRLKISMDHGKDDIMLLDSIIEILTAIAKGK